MIQIPTTPSIGLVVIPIDAANCVTGSALCTGAELPSGNVTTVVVVTFCSSIRYSMYPSKEISLAHSSNPWRISRPGSSGTGIAVAIPLLRHDDGGTGNHRNNGAAREHAVLPGADMVELRRIALLPQESGPDQRPTDGNRAARAPHPTRQSPPAPTRGESRW